MLFLLFVTLLFVIGRSQSVIRLNSTWPYEGRHCKKCHLAAVFGKLLYKDFERVNKYKLLFFYLYFLDFNLLFFFNVFAGCA